MAAPVDKLLFTSRRSAMMGRYGMVAASQPLAAEIGMRILKAGGNAADAAVAVAAALNVTEPCSTGIGGDCFALYYNAKTRAVEALNGSGRAPQTLTLERARAEGLPESKVPHEDDSLPHFHPHTVTVPGAAAGWADTIDKWGTMKLADVLEPAAELAEKGFPVSPVAAYHWNKGLEVLKNGPHWKDMTVDGAAPKPGQIFTNKHLAETFRLLGREGKDGFYKGRIADAIVDLLKSLGGSMTHEDLVAHVSTFPEPIKVNYKGVDVYEVPPNGQGITALVALNILENFDVDALGHNGPAYLHHLIEALRLAFADTRWYVADPDVTDVPIKELLSKDYAAGRSKLMDPSKAMVDPKRGSPVSSSDTVSFQVIDGEGNACSFINSNYMGFGTGLIPEGCGFTLQNRGANFSLFPDHPNALAPGKRPYHTIIPAMATRGDELYASFSVMGGFMQPQGHVQVLLNLLRGMDPQVALDVPRFCIGSGHTGSSGAVALEDGIDDDTVKALAEMGHEVVVVKGHGRSLFGRGQIITRDPATGVLIAGSDGRADGCAMGW